MFRLSLQLARVAAQVGQLHCMVSPYDRLFWCQSTLFIYSYMRQPMCCDLTTGELQLTVRYCSLMLAPQCSTLAQLLYYVDKYYTCAISFMVTIEQWLLYHCCDLSIFVPTSQFYKYCACDKTIIGNIHKQESTKLGSYWNPCKHAEEMHADTCSQF